jgi:DNA-directed RNA polymerase specialized sigma24 family protein
MEREEAFDSFYASTRRQVLLQAFALTGDLPAAHGAVRDAYVGAWQHWRKVSRLDDPLGWVRRRAWQLAQRRHTGRIWHRNKGLSAEGRAVLDALAGLPTAERRVLVLVELAGLPAPRAARELGVTADVAQRNLGRATERVGAALGLPAARVREPLAALDDELQGAPLPRGSIVRRAGRKRRHATVLGGTAAAVAVALASGAFAFEPSSGPTGPGTHASAPSSSPSSPGPSSPAPSASPPTGLPSPGDLLDRDQVRRLGAGQAWRVLGTSDNTAGRGINSVCQQSRFADPHGYAALVRRFRATGDPRRSAVQTVEVSPDAAEAARAFRTTVGWYAGCRVGRLQLLHAYRVDNIGDQAAVLMVRLWHEPVTTLSVAVARTGSVVTSTVGTTVGGRPPAAGQITQSLADSVAMLCGRSGSADCAKRPTYRVVPPPPSGEARGLLAVADLPPVGRIDRPWVGTDPARTRANPAATPCDRVDVGAAPHSRSRSYLIPGAAVPTRFGLSETYGVFASSSAADRFLDRLRAGVETCATRDLASHVGGRHDVDRRSPQLEASTWALDTKVSAREAVPFRVGFVRVGRTVAEVTFAPSPSDDMTEAAFRSLLVRAGERLRELR